jgi:hypothetical protein
MVEVYAASPSAGVITTSNTALRPGWDGLKNADWTADEQH